MAKKKDDRAAALLVLAFLLAIVLYGAYGKNFNWGGGFDQPPTQNNSNQCCCDDPNSYILQLPGQDCRCVKCVEDIYSNILVDENGDICCTEGDCDMFSTTTTTLPCHMEGIPLGLSYMDPTCSGSCTGSNICVYDPRTGDCGCKPDCEALSTNGDVKACYDGYCQNVNEYCGVTIDGRECACIGAVL